MRGRGSACSTARAAREVGRQNAEVVSITSARWRLHRSEVSTPPWAGGPPGGAEPDIAVLLHVAQHSGDGTLADRVGTTGELAQESEFAIALQPLCGSLDTLLANGCADAGVRCARTIRVEILVHLVDDLVLGVCQADQVAIHGRPCPGTTPRVSFHENVLRGGPGSSDGVNGRLVEVQNQSLVLGVEFVVCRCQ